jgi:uncharacterized protein
MEKNHYAPGEPCWMDMGTDVAKASKFYSSLFGWTVTDLGEEAGGYQMATLGGAEVAGFGPQQNPGPPFWNVYFCTHDVARSVEVVRSNGGSVLVEPMDAMGAGTFAVCADPVGAAFSLWQPKDMKGFGEVDAAGTFCWAELVTADLDTSKKFYGALFGWNAKDGEDPAMAYTEFQLGVTSVAGMMPRPDMMPAETPSYWGVYFAVDDTDEAVTKIGTIGGSVLAGPMTIPIGRWATCVDDAGAVFSVIAMSAG